MSDTQTIELLRRALAVAEAQQSAQKATIRELWRPWLVWAREHRPSVKLSISHERGLLETELEVAGQVVRLGDLQWSQLNVRVWEQWRARVRRRDGGEMAPGTRNSHLTSLQAMFRWHVENGALPSNPATGLPRESEAENERQGWFTPDAFARLLAHAHPMLQQILTVSIRCGGLRHGEVRCLRKDEIDWDSREILIRAAREKTRIAKTVIIVDDAWEILGARKALAPGDYLFPSPRDPRGSRPVCERTVQEWMVRAREAAGLKLLGENPVVHHTRHSFYMQNLAKTNAPPLNWLMDQAGHRGAATVARYARLRGGEAKERMREMLNAPLVLERKPARRGAQPEKKVKASAKK